VVALPVNGPIKVAQRYSADWEQLDASGRICAGPQKKLESYTIFVKPTLAVADARVASVVDGLPEQTPGKFPMDQTRFHRTASLTNTEFPGHRQNSRHRSF
jgi:hypothetical protein